MQTAAAEPPQPGAGSGCCMLCGRACEAAGWRDRAAEPDDLARALCVDHRHELARVEAARPGCSRPEAVAAFLESQSARRGRPLRRFRDTLAVLRR